MVSKLLRKLFGVGQEKIKIPKSKEERISALRSVIAIQASIEKKIDEKEEELSYSYNIKTDQEYEDFINDEEIKKKEPEYHEMLLEYKILIKKRVLIEKDFFNIRKGVYLGIGVDLENIDLTMPMQITYIPWQHWENHAEVMGTTRYGKTYLLALIAYQMILKGWDIVLIDPKGGKKQELLSWMIQFAMECGREEDVFFFNPAYTKVCTLLNPLFGMSNSEIASVVSLLSEGDGEKKDDFFSSISFVVVLGITTALEYLQMTFDPTGEKTRELEKEELMRYYDLTEMKGSKLESFEKETKIAAPDASMRMITERTNFSTNIKRGDLTFNRTLITFRELEYYANHDNLKALHDFVQSTPPPSRDAYSEEDFRKVLSLRDEATRLLGQIAVLGEFYLKISMSLTALLAKLSTGEIGELFCTVRINPLLNRVYREDKGLIAIVQPAPLKFQKTSDMVNKVFIKMFESLFGTVSVTGRGFHRRIGFLIDEAKVALFRGIEEIYNKAGGMGMTIIAFMQSEKDRILKVGDVISEIISDNTNTKIYLKVNNFASKENIVKDFGTRRVHKRNTMGTDIGSKTMVTTEEEYLITTNSIDKLQKGQAFVSTYGKKYLVKFPFILPPEGEIVMPAIKEEGTLREMIANEIDFEAQRDSLNNEIKEHLGGSILDEFESIKKSAQRGDL